MKNHHWGRSIDGMMHNARAAPSINGLACQTGLLIEQIVVKILLAAVQLQPTEYTIKTGGINL